MTGWRAFHFNYSVPDGVEWEPLEDRMLEAILPLIGCECSEDSDRCDASWVAVSSPIADTEPDP